MAVRWCSSWSAGLAAVLMVLGLVGCGADGTQSSSPNGSGRQQDAVSGSVTVSAAASLSVAFTQIGKAFEAAHPGTKVTFNFDSSSTLAAQIAEGAPADVFASADEASMTTLSDNGLLAGKAEAFARNQLVIVTKPGNPQLVMGLADLAKLASTSVVSLCAASAPCGKYAAQALQRANASIPEGRISRGQNVTATLTAVSEGDAAAGVVYASDAARAGDRVETVVIPTAHNVTATYPIGVIAASTNPVAANEFRRFVLGIDGQKVLRNNAFLPAP